MARIDSLGNFLTDVADAIREKKGTTDVIPASQFDTEIASIESGGNTITKGLVINACNDRGYPIDVSIVGLTSIPSRFLYTTTSYETWSSHVEKFTLPENLQAIYSSAFYGFSGFIVTKLPDTLQTIGDTAFRGCSKLAITEVPEGVTVLNSGIFNNCTGLTELTFKGDVTLIYGSVFWGCSGLVKIVFSNITSIPTLSNINAFNSTPIASGTGYIYVPDDLVDSFKTASNWSTYAEQIKPISELE